MGKVAQAVVSVGGLLGIGNKLVAVPFNRSKFEQSRGAMVGDTPIGSTGGDVTAPDAGTGDTAATPAHPAPAPPVRSAAQNYFRAVLPGATKNR
jgi:hypothetical protein